MDLKERKALSDKSIIAYNWTLHKGNKGNVSLHSYTESKEPTNNYSSNFKKYFKAEIFPVSKYFVYNNKYHFICGEKVIQAPFETLYTPGNGKVGGQLKSQIDEIVKISCKKV
jgi:hypothetical protein